MEKIQADSNQSWSDYTSIFNKPADNSMIWKLGFDEHFFVNVYKE